MKTLPCAQRYEA